MTQFIKGGDGKFAGSIGSGKANVPSPSEIPNNPVTLTPSDEQPSESNVRNVYAAYQEVKPAFIDTSDPTEYQPQPGGPIREWRATRGLQINWEDTGVRGIEHVTLELDSPGLHSTYRDLIEDDKASQAMRLLAADLRAQAAALEDAADTLEGFEYDRWSASEDVD